MRMITVSGRIVKDAKIEHSKKGKPYLSFRIANVEPSDPKDENGKDVPTWYSIRTTDKYCMKMRDTLVKGKPIIVTGRLTDTAFINQSTGEPEVNRNIYALSINYVSCYTPIPKSDRPQTIRDINQNVGTPLSNENNELPILDDLPF